MSMYHLQKAFEQTLRSPSSTVVTTIETTPLKTEIHKGCTGKAHACGTIKNRVVKLREIKESSNQRKNSLSSETISDSGSEISNIEVSSSWGNEKPHFTRSLSKPRNSLPLPPPSSSVSSSPSPVVTTNQPQFNRNGIQQHQHQRRRTIENVVSLDEVDKLNNKFNSDSGLHTDDENINGNGLQRNGHRRSFRKSSTPTRPPWQNVYSKTSAAAAASHSPSPVQRTNSLRSSFRSSSFRRKGDNWNALWQKSFSYRYGGGVYKTLEALLLDKVNAIAIS